MAVKKMVGEIKRRIRWERYSGCFECGLPQSRCSRFEGVGETGGYRMVRGKQCQYGGVLVQAVVSMWGVEGARAEGFFRQRMGLKGRGWEDVGDIGRVVGWMGGKAYWGGIESNEMCKALVGLEEIWRGGAGEMVGEGAGEG